MKDPYDVLGVPRTASPEEIKRAYRELVRKYHPDRHHENPLGDLAEEKMREINEAFEILTGERSGRTSGGGRAGPSGAASPLQAELEEISRLIATGRHSSAVSRADDMIRVHGDVGMLYALKGAALMQLKRFPEAQAAFETAHRLDPTNGEVASAVGAAYFGAGDPQNAIRMFEQARRNGYDNTNMLMMEGLCHEQLGDRQTAERIFAQVEAEDPHNEVLRARKRSWKVGRGYVDKQGARGTATDACCLCLLLDCVFDCC